MKLIINIFSEIINDPDMIIIYKLLLFVYCPHAIIWLLFFIFND